MSGTNEPCDRSPGTFSTPETAAGRLWPSRAYVSQVEKLRAAVGRRIYLVEIKPTNINVGVGLDGSGHELLGVVDFPRGTILARRRLLQPGRVVAARSG